MKRVLFRSPLLTLSGYGTHARQVSRWLLSRSDIDVKFQPTPWGSTPWCPDRNRFDGLIGKIIDRTVDFNQKGFDVAISLCLPNEWDPTLAKYNIGMTAGIETDRCNPIWTQACNNMDLIIVPSTHARHSLNPAQIKKSIVEIPESFPDECLIESKKSMELSTDFNFLVFGQLTGDNPFNDRKNTFFTLKWLFEEFKNDKNVGVVLKTNLGRNTLIDRNNVIELVKKLISEVRNGPYPRVHLVHGDLSDSDVVSLYKNPKIKALVSATRGEGFGLPVLEAAACELPVITTGWSGHMDFMKKGKFIELFYQLTDVHKSRIDNNIFIAGSRWAEVSEQDFKKKVRKFYSSTSIPKQWAIDLAKIIKTDYSFTTICKTYNEVLKDFI